MSVSEEEILPAVIAALEEATQNKIAVTPTTVLRQDLNLDSLAEMDLIMALEDRFDVSISINHLPEIDTVAELAAMIAKMKKG